MKKSRFIIYIFMILLSFFVMHYKVNAEETKVYWDESIGENSQQFGFSLCDYLIDVKSADEDTVLAIEEITFNDVSKTNNTINDFDYSYDISRNQNGSVIAGIIDNHLYIQYSGTLYFNQASRGVFGSNLYGRQFEFVAINGLEYISTSEVEDMSMLFYDCSSLEEIDLSSFDTSNTTDVHDMFCNCIRLTTLDLSAWDTSNIVDMQSLFQNCKNLRTINFEGWDTSSVTNMGYMFSNCIKIKELDLSSLNMSNVTTTYGMFQFCSALEKVTLSNYQTTNLTNTSVMFENCTSLTTIIFNQLNTSKVTEMWGMFENCENLVSLDLSGFNTSKVTNMSWMFAGCKKLENINLSSFETSKVTTMNRMFSDCTSLKTINLSSFNTNRLNEMEKMFYNCSNLNVLDLSNFNLYYVTNMNNFIDRCYNLKVFITPLYEGTIVLPTTLYDESFNEYSQLVDIEQNTAFRKKYNLYYSYENINPKVILYGTPYGELPEIQRTGYAFQGWYKTDDYQEQVNSSTVFEEESDITIYPKFEINTYIVTWKNYDGTVLETDTVEYGMIPVYDGETPIREGNDQYSYTFNNWDKQVTFVTEDTVYTATYTQAINRYNVLFIDEDGVTILKLATEYDYGTSKDDIVLPETPTKPSTSEYRYIFDGWTPELEDVTRDIVYTATYRSERNLVYWDTEIGYKSRYYSYGYSLGEYLISKGASTTDINYIEGIVFNDTLRSHNTVTNFIDEFDVSRNQDGSVIAGIKNDILYIQYEGTLVFNTQASGIFNERFNNLTYINGFEYISTEETTDMSYMFYNAKGITTLDLSSFDTSHVTNMSNMFVGMENLISLNISSFDTSNVTNMNWMFCLDHKLASLNLANFDTSHVTDMSHMFGDMYELINLNISSFDTSNVTDMSGMFSYTTKLRELDLSHFDTSNVTNMNFMFRGMNSLEELDISVFNTSNVTQMSYMFSECSSLASLNISSFNTSKVTDMSNMFSYMNNLTSIDLSNFNTSRVTNMGNMFLGMSNVSSINISYLDTSRVSYMNGLFSGMTKLISINFGNIDTSRVMNMSGMFQDCTSLTSLNISSFNTSRVTDMSYMFSGCSNLISLDLSSFDTSNVTNMNNMFAGTTMLSSLDISSFNTSKVTNMTEMFKSMENLNTIDLRHFDVSGLSSLEKLFYNSSGFVNINLSGWDTSNVNIMSRMFQGCTNLESINLSGWDYTELASEYYIFSDCDNLEYLDLSNSIFGRRITLFLSDLKHSNSFKKLNLKNGRVVDVSDLSYLFSGLTNIEELNLNGFDTTGVTNMSYMFESLSKLKSLDVSSFDTSKVTNMRYMFYGCSGLTSLDVSDFNTSKVTEMGSMFAICSSLTELDLSNFDTSNVTDMSGMFSQNNNLETLDVSGFDTSNVTDMRGMFNKNNNLETLDLSSFDTSKVTDMSSMFGGDSKLNTIYISNNFVLNTSLYSHFMFNDCTNLKGYNGTTYDIYNTDKTYARIDAMDQSGYFSIKGGISSDVYTIDHDARKIYADGKVVDLDNIITDNVTVELDDELGLVTSYKGLRLRAYSIENNSYTITWKNYDGTVLKTDTVEYGLLPLYVGVTPTKEGNEQYSYVFDGWDKQVTLVTGDTTYTATFTQVVNKYTVTFMDDNNEVISSKEYDYGTAVADIDVPDDLEDMVTPQYTFRFIGWQPEITTVTGNATYYPEYDVTTNKYTVTFMDDNNEVISSREYEYGTLSAFIEVPDDLDDIVTPQYTFRFIGWQPELATVTHDVTYYPNYEQSINKYTITWKDEDGTVLEVDENVEYGLLPTYDGSTPTKERTAQYSYTFAGWDKEVTTVTKDETYTATYTQVVNKYTVTFMDDNNEVISSKQYDYGTVVNDIEVPEDLDDIVTPQYTFRFIGWQPEITMVTHDVTYYPNYEQTVNTYTVIWKNYDGSVLETDTVEYGMIPIYDDEIPTRERTAEFTYTFNNWDKQVTFVTENTIYTATYTQTINKYSVTFVDEDGISVLKESTSYDYGTSKDDIIKPEDPTKEGNAEYTYTFDGWTPELENVVKDITYKAKYKSTKNQYTVTFKNEDGSVISSVKYDYGTSVNDIEVPEDPTKEGNAQYSYIFDGWDKEIVEVTENATYTATYRSVINKYTITWKDYDGTVLEKDENVEYGLLPTYDGENLVRENTAEYTYSFKGWDKEITTVTKNETYTAEYNETKNKYTVIWKNYDGSILETDENVEYGVLPTYDGETPVKKGNDEYSYTFTGWDKEVTTVKGKTIYTATFSEGKNQYTVTFKNDDGIVISSKKYDYGTSASDIEVPENPTKESTHDYTYTFTGWDKEITDVTKNETYTAIYDSHERIYVQNIELNIYDVVLNLHDTYKITATITPDNVNEDKTLTWSSSNENIVTVDEDGNIEAIGFGKSVISVRSSNDIVANCNVEVSSKIATPELSITSNANKAILTWEEKKNAKNYTLYKSIDNKKWSKLDTTDETTYEDKGLTYGKTYYYKLKACNENECSKYSAVVSKKIKPNKVNLRIKSAGTNNVKLEWDRVKVTGYQISRSTDNKNWSSIKTITSSKTLEYNNKSLKANKTYYYKVRAYKTVSGKKIYGSWSTVVSTKTAPVKPSFEVKLKDYNAMNLVIGYSKGTSEYRVYRSLDDKNWERIATLPVEGTLVDSDHEVGRVYYYKVKACNSKGNCSGYVYKELKQTPKTPKLTLATSSKKVTITVGSVNGADGYKVYRATSKSGKYELIKELSSEDELTFDNKTTKGKTYYYKVRSYRVVDGSKIYSPYSGIKSIKSK